MSAAKTFAEQVRDHCAHVASVAALCKTEETTKQALILPFLQILGFSPFDPNQVVAEYKADILGVKASERVDYALLSQGRPVMYIEAKPYGNNINRHVPQLARYFNASPEVACCIITNGRHWQFFTDLVHKNIMDSEPFLSVDLNELSDEDIERLERFQRSQFRSEGLHELAESSAYQGQLHTALQRCLRDWDDDFLRFLVQKAGLRSQPTAPLLAQLRPLAQRALEGCLGEMLRAGRQPAAEEDQRDIVHPDNPNIVTTWNERRLLRLVQGIIGDNSLTATDTEEDYIIHLVGAPERWLCRYFDRLDRARLLLPLTLNEVDIANINSCGLAVEDNHIILGTPENVLRIAFVLLGLYAELQP